MDITSGIVTFGRACPGKVMHSLQHSHPTDVANIKSLQLSFSRYKISSLCTISCKDLTVAQNFITSISALEALSVLNYEQDGSILWPVVFHHAHSLRRLAIHTPPHPFSDKISSSFWNVQSLTDVATRLPNLRHLEMDFPLEEAERLLKEGVMADVPVMEVLARKLQRLDSLVIHIEVRDVAEGFAELRTSEGREFSSFQERLRTACEGVARAVVVRFEVSCPEEYTKLRLKVRFAHYTTDDRSEPWIVALSAEAALNKEAHVDVDIGDGWRDYLPGEGTYGSLLWGLNQ